jgi:hypothetical protein
MVGHLSLSLLRRRDAAAFDDFRKQHAASIRLPQAIAPPVAPTERAP